MSRPMRFVGCAIGCLGLVLLITAAAVVSFGTRRLWLPALAYALNVSASPRHADVIIVLGGGDGDREAYGSVLFRRGLASHLIATGAPVGTDAQAVDLAKRGVPRQAIFLADGTQNTHDDALRSRRIMETHGWQTALLVTDRYHIRRSLWTFETAFHGTSLQVWPTPVVGGWFDDRHWWQSENGFVAVDDEYLKLIYYLAKGYISPTAVMRG